MTTGGRGTACRRPASPSLSVQLRVTVRQEPRPSPAPGRRLLAGTGLVGGLEVLGGDLLQELLEPLDLVVLLLGDGDAGLVEQRLLGEDRGAGAQRQRDRVGGPRADLDPAVEDQAGVEDLVLEGDDA